MDKLTKYQGDIPMNENPFYKKFLAKKLIKHWKLLFIFLIALIFVLQFLDSDNQTKQSTFMGFLNSIMIYFLPTEINRDK